MVDQVEKETGRIITFSDQAHREAVSGISDASTQVGHPTSPEKVDPQGEAETVLAKIESAGVGAQVVDLADRFKKSVGNFAGDVAGSQNIYQTQGSQTGHRTTMNRIAKKVRSSGIAAKIRHLLFADKKAA